MVDTTATNTANTVANPLRGGLAFDGWEVCGTLRWIWFMGFPLYGVRQAGASWTCRRTRR